MIDRRMIVHDLLVSTFPEVDGRVYFRPPSTLEAVYPHIRYELQTIETHKALNAVYSSSDIYRVTVLSALPGLLDINRFMEDPRVTFVRSYTTNNVVHVIYEITMH